MTDAERERAAVVAWLRAAITYSPDGSAYGWDREMRSYAEGFADDIERGAHLKEDRP